MRPPGYQALACLATLLLPWALAQGTSSSGSGAAAALALMPKCGVECLVAAISNSPCALTNTTCVCANAAINAHTTACVAANCTIVDGLSTKNASNTICEVPVVDNSASLETTSLTLAVISDVLVAVRFVYKLSTRQELGWDDYLVIAVVLAGIPSVVITDRGTIPNGLGRDVWTLTPTQITDFVFYFYIMEILYFLQIALLKLTLLFFFLKVFPGKDIRRILWSTIAFTIIWGLIFVFIAIFQCSPISFYWTNWNGLSKGRCLNVNAIGWANAAISIVLDGWMLAVPLWQIKGLNMNWKKKAGVSLMFCVGTFVTVVSIIRLRALVGFAASPNPTQDNAMVSLWSYIEVNVGIFCACMPVLRLMIVRLVPALGSTNRSRGYGGGGGGGGGTGSKPLGSSQSRNRSRSTHAVLDGGDAHPPPRAGPKDNGLYQQAFAGQYSDETSLVHMRDMGYDKGYDK